VKPLTLYDYPASANCYKVRLLLAQLEWPYERMPIDIFAGDTLTDEFGEKSSARTTPVLQVGDGRFVHESNAILMFLAHGSRFTPSDRFDIAQVIRWLVFEQTDLMPSIGGLRFRLVTGRITAASPDAVRRLDGAHEALRLLDRHLRDRPFLIGASYSIADIATYGYVHVAPEAGVDLNEYVSVRSWLERVEQQPLHMNDLAPYPANALAGCGRSIYD